MVIRLLKDCYINEPLFARLPLSIMKTKIKKSLAALELENVVTRKDGYQEIINLIAKVSAQGVGFVLNEPRYEKTSFLHMRKQRRRSASR